MKTSRVVVALGMVLFLLDRVLAQVPLVLNHQGRVGVGGIPFSGSGQFKFALVNGDASQTYWLSGMDTSPADGQPDTALGLPVSQGLYSVGLGNTALMPGLDASMLAHPDVRLRVWFNDGSHGLQLLVPDERLGSTPYAVVAATATTVSDGAITSSKIAPGTVGNPQLATDAQSLNKVTGGVLESSGGRVSFGDSDLLLRGPGDANHGLGWYGTSSLNKLYGGVNVDGPVLYGYSGGALGSSQGGPHIVLNWLANGNVGIGNNSPSTALQVNGTVTASAFAGNGSALTDVTVASSHVVGPGLGPLEWVKVGSPGNMSHTFGTGAVGHIFQIGKYEVSNAQYARFLNAVGASDISLYNTAMGSDPRGGIVRSGAFGSYTYSVKKAMGNKPVNYVSFWDALRFCNWIHNGMPNGPQGNSTTDDGAYTITISGLAGNTVTRNPGALCFLPNLDEWIKAAFFDPNKGGAGVPGYWHFATQSDDYPDRANSDGIGNINNPSLNIANHYGQASWNGQAGNVTTVGSGGPGSESAFGAADMAGNVGEWNESNVPDPSSGHRYVLGADWSSINFALVDPLLFRVNGFNESSQNGFRVASP